MPLNCARDLALHRIHILPRASEIIQGKPQIGRRILFALTAAGFVGVHILGGSSGPGAPGFRCLGVGGRPSHFFHG